MCNQTSNQVNSKKVIGVKFKANGKTYHFDPLDFAVEIGDGVIVETIVGVEFGEVYSCSTETQQESIAPLKPIMRVASDQDKIVVGKNKKLQDEAKLLCQKKIEQHKLDMHLVDVEYAFTGGKITFYFTSDGRVDFRELVKDLASVFKTRIELRQIGVRDEAKLIGGIGCCGRVVCCNEFLEDFHTVSIKMAKEQNLSLSPTKISGLCGRLMCCLKYEQDCYEKISKYMPKVGREIQTPDGYAIVTEVFTIAEKVKARIRLQDGSYDLREYKVSEIIEQSK